MTDEMVYAPDPRLADTAAEGLVIGSGRGGDWQVAVSGATLACRLRGRLKAGRSRLDHLAVGDHVLVRASSEEPERGVIEAVLPRSNQLARGRPGKPAQVIASNLDQAVIVAAVSEPFLSLHTVDRFLALITTAGLPAVLVLNKCDFDPTCEIREAVAEIYEPLGVRVLSTSVATGAGLTAVDDALAARVSVIIGQSGTGKSSLLNALYPGLDLRVAEISESVNKGRHTTVGAHMHPLPDGGYVVDTPGLREVGLWGITARDLERCFPEFAPALQECRFADCRHLSEPECGVRSALDAGSIARSRYESYVKLREEVEESDRVW